MEYEFPRLGTERILNEVEQALTHVLDTIREYGGGMTVCEIGDRFWRWSEPGGPEAILRYLVEKGYGEMREDPDPPKDREPSPLFCLHPHLASFGSTWRHTQVTHHPKETPVKTDTKSPEPQAPVSDPPAIPAPPASADGPEHTCRRPTYNAMVDTCPGCGAPEADAVKAEADKNPLRHVRASRWVVHPLLQYHYLPYWPRNVSDVFATIDIKRNMVVAACVFAYPVLRSHLREGVFGRLSPDTLNRDFRQLVRWMVHPDYRAQAVGSDLLKWSFARIDQPVVEAINRSWVPIEAFQRLGMVERSEGDMHYYYRLKDCRKRVDEIKDPPVQAEPPEGAILHTYPRIWTPRLHLADASFIALIQPYAGSLLRTHHWDATSYTAFYDASTKLQDVETSDGFVEITDAKKREVILRRMAQGVPGLNNN